MFYPKFSLPAPRSLAGFARGALAAFAAAWLAGCAAPERYPVTDFSAIVVDAGHGGHDSGALSRRGRGRKSGPALREKDLALDVARSVGGRLRAAGLRVVMTREGDVFVPLDTRVAISNRQRRSIFVSIHFNDSRRRAVHGAEVYHNGRGTLELARRIARKLDAVPSLSSRGVSRANYRVLRNSTGPALLVECSYLSNPAEAARCASPAYRERIAEAVAAAILEQRRG